MEKAELAKLIVRLENAAEYLEICARVGPVDMAWDAPIIERRFTAMEVMRQGVAYLRTEKLPEST